MTALQTPERDGRRAQHGLDARTGARLGEAAAFGAFVDEDTVVTTEWHTLRVVALRTGDAVARALFFHYPIATAGPRGELVVAAHHGSDPGPVEVFELRRPAVAPRHRAPLLRARRDRTCTPSLPSRVNRRSRSTA